MLPNDMQELDRLDLQHYLLRSILTSNCTANMTEVYDVLDIGTGTGIWILEMANEFPHVKFVGMDIAPLQPHNTLPKTCRFDLGNVLDGLTYQDGSFDYVHQRLLMLGIPEDSWKDLLQEYYRVLNPGGQLEIVETDLLLKRRTPVMKKLQRWIETVLDTHGISAKVVREMDTLMMKAGFRHITTRTIKVPLGSWAGPEGEAGWQNMMEGIKAFQTAVCTLLNIRPHEFQQVVDEVGRESNEMQSYWQIYIYLGTKPTNTDRKSSGSSSVSNAN